MGQDTIETPAPGSVVAPRPPATKGGRRGRGTRRRDPSAPCLNCGDETTGRFCPACGQRKTDIQVSLRALVLDTLEEELTVDRRVPATLGALFLEPGQLTVEYVNGRVARYLRPVRLYLVSSLLFFLVLSFMSLQFLRGAMAPQEEVEARQALEVIRAELENPGLHFAPRLVLESIEVELVRQSQAGEGRAGAAEEPEGPGPAAPEPDAQSGEPTEGEAPGETGEGSAGFQQALAEITDLDLGHPTLTRAANAKIRQLQRMEPREAAERVAQDFLRIAPTVMFFLLPVFALALKGLYIRRRRFYAEHFIFLLHTHSFIFLQFTVLLLLVAVGWTPGWLVAGVMGWMLLYTYLALKRVYGQGWLKTLAKWWTLGWVYFWVLLPTVLMAFLAAALLV